MFGTAFNFVWGIFCLIAGLVAGCAAGVAVIVGIVYAICVAIAMWDQLIDYWSKK